MKYLFLVLLIPFFAKAAPLPTTGSSAVNSPKWNTAFSQMGFSFGLVSDEWLYLNNPMDDHQPRNQQIDLGFKTLSETARLSLKSETLKSKINLESYVKKYLRDYNQYGFEVLTTKSLKMNNSPVVVVDLIQKNKATQSRQVFFSSQDKTDNRITVASCLDKTETFSLTSSMCNQLLDKYNWR